MVAPYDRTKLTEAQDRLINLLVQHDEASRAEDWRRLKALDRQIDTARAHHNALRARPDEDVRLGRRTGVAFST